MPDDRAGRRDTGGDAAGLAPAGAASRPPPRGCLAVGHLVNRCCGSTPNVAPAALDIDVEPSCSTARCRRTTRTRGAGATTCVVERGAEEPKVLLTDFPTLFCARCREATSFSMGARRSRSSARSSSRRARRPSSPCSATCARQDRCRYAISKRRRQGESVNTHRGLLPREQPRASRRGAVLQLRELNPRNAFQVVHGPSTSRRTRRTYLLEENAA